MIAPVSRLYRDGSRDRRTSARNETYEPTRVEKECVPDKSLLLAHEGRCKISRTEGSSSEGEGEKASVRKSRVSRIFETPINSDARESIVSTWEICMETLRGFRTFQGQRYLSSNFSRGCDGISAFGNVLSRKKGNCAALSCYRTAIPSG